MYSYIKYFTLTITFHITFGCEHYNDPACLDVKPIDGDHFMNQYIAEIEGGEEIAIQVARDTGLGYKKPMKSHENHYLFTHPDVYDRHKMRHEGVLKVLRDHADVRTADQQYVWQPTIRELEHYEDMVGLEDPIEVRTSHFHPDEVEFEGKTAYELIRPDDVFREPENMSREYPPLHTIVDFDKLYEEKNREKEKRAQERRLKEELKIKQEAERKAAEKKEVKSDHEMVEKTEFDKKQSQTEEIIESSHNSNHKMKADTNGIESQTKIISETDHKAEALANEEEAFVEVAPQE